MPTVPRFHLEQDDAHVRVVIRVPYVRVNQQTLQTHVDGTTFSFYCKPYLLNLNLPEEVVDTDQNPARAVYDMGDQHGTVTIHLPKSVPGTAFQGLDLLTKLMSGNGSKQTGEQRQSNLIEVVESAQGETKASSSVSSGPRSVCLVCLPSCQCTSDQSCDFFRYGFGNQFQNFLKKPLS